MSTDLVTTFIRQLRATQLLDEEQQNEVERLGQTAAQLRDLAGELVKREWITAFQANQLARGKAAELVLGSYIILKPLASGGMGQVFRARHRHLQRDVALKFIRPEQRDSQELVQRFRREVQLLADLRHPNIVQAHDAGNVGDIWFLAMELLEGVNLDELVHKQGPLPVGYACAYLRQAALGLQHAHERGLVHRDIKPSNLFLTVEGIKVLDLGLARPQAINEDGQAGGLTRANTVMGTPDYLAPEQALDPRRADARSDIYSLGCTLFFLLAGKPPFPEEGTLAQKLLYHQQSEPPRLVSLRSDVPTALAEFVCRMLAKVQDQRPASAAEVADFLEPLANKNACPAGFSAAGKTDVKSGGRPPLTTPQGPAKASLVNAKAATPERGFTLVAESLAGGAPSLVNAKAQAPERGFTLTAESLPPTASSSAAPPESGAEERGWTLPLESLPPTTMPPAASGVSMPPPYRPPTALGMAVPPPYRPPTAAMTAASPPNHPGGRGTIMLPLYDAPAAPAAAVPPPYHSAGALESPRTQARRHRIIALSIIGGATALFALIAALIVVPMLTSAPANPPGGSSPVAGTNTPGGNPPPSSTEKPKENPKQTRPDSKPQDLPPAEPPKLPMTVPPGAIFTTDSKCYLSDLEEFFVQAGPWPFAKKGVLNLNKLILVGGKLSPKGLSMHPPPAPSYAAVKYRLKKEAAIFKAVVAVDDTTNFCWTPATFTVLGDGRELWKSKWIAHNHLRQQECQVDVTGVDVLELRVHCEGHNLNVYAVWVEPRLLQKTDTAD